ncbi:helix-turn-helix domain-containing protein [Nonomuraea sp. NPDC050202]|uniref:winged helix-turn-helix transcriptional regulator n=1 Tax=Nonomuraea sp. NPDC050202 TaxID=3155035 RepID=UPI0033CF102B
MARVLEPTGDAGAGTATFRRRPCDDEEVTDRCEFDGIEGEAEIGLCADQFTQTLRGLERDGLVERTLYPTVPPRVEYALTGGGSALRHTVYGMCAWTRRYLEHIEETRERFDRAPQTAATPVKSRPASAGR